MLKGLCNGKMKNVVILFLLVVLSACSTWRPAEQPKIGRATNFNQTSNLLETLLVKDAVLRELGISPKMSVRGQQTTTFLFVKKEEEEYFVRRYSGLAPVVKVRADEEATMVDGDVVDRETGKRAIVYNVSVISLAGTNAKAEGGYIYATLGGVIYAYDLRLERGRWRIIKKEISGAF
jgi:hypothetical protein